MARFHVFLSHSSHDKPAVQALKPALASQRLRCWLDEEQLRPGLPWQDLLSQGIESSASIAICVAGDGLGPWEDEEMQTALRLAVRNRRPVIPVLLPGAPELPELPMFLGNRTWVDLRIGLDSEGIAKLVWGITGERSEERLRTPRTAGDDAPTASESVFLDEVLELLHTYPTLILLAQEDRDQRTSLEALGERAQIRFGADKVLHLVPPRSADASEAEFFRALGKRAGMDPPARSAMDFEDYLEGRLRRW